MIVTAGDWVDLVVGIDVGALDLNIGQMAARAFIVYLFAIVVLRISDKRFLGQNTVFDIILGIMLGSIFSRAITGSSAFFPTLAAGTALVGLHWILALVTFHLDSRSTFVKGSSQKIIQDGELLHDQLRHHHISEGDLLESLRLRGGTSDPANVAEAHLERNGDISVVGRGTKSPQVVEVTVKDGVQTVRIEIQ